MRLRNPTVSCLLGLHQRCFGQDLNPILRLSLLTRLSQYALLFGALGLPLWSAVDAQKPTAAQPSPSFQTTVEPFLAKSCYGCHNAKAKVAGLNLQAYSASTGLAEHREMWETVLRRIKAGEMPPKPLPRPNRDELQAVTNWMETQFDDLDLHAKPEAGRVTARRLNKAEYDNTIRDLLALNIAPAADFPQDDSGYGFDNIGDVLSLSPVLMEKYLNAAEKISRMAVFGAEPMKPSLIRLQTVRAKTPPVTVVPATYDETGLSLPNAFHATHQFPIEAEYGFRIGLAGFRPAGSEPFSVTLWLDGKPIKTQAVDVSGRLPESLPWEQDLSGKMVELRVRIPAGEHWLAASIPHLYEGLPAALHGPNPSRLPPPSPPDFDSVIKPPKNATPERLAFYKRRLSEAIKSSNQLNGARIGNVELIGPFNPNLAPSLETRKKIYVCGHLNGHHEASCARKIVTNLARNAFRRPVSATEVDRYLQLVTQAQKDGDSFEGGISLALQALLVSPDFLFRIETSPAPRLVAASTASGDAQRINEYELASRLSYFIWSSTPDAELLRCADLGTLRKPDVLKAQVQRMLKDPRSFALAENFGGQWLEFRALESVKPDHDRFPEYDSYLRMSMQRETELFVDSIVRDDRSILDLIAGKYTFVNQRLAEFYKIPGVTGPEFRRIDLSNVPERGGVITQASVLTVSSYATRTSPVLRGKWVLENILNDPPPPPPPGVPNLDVAAVGTTISLRQQMEKHRANPICASCHQRMDPLGFGLENYNAIGAWRTQDGKFPVDPAGTLPNGKSFHGPDELKAILAGDQEVFTRCLTEKLLTYALGRGLERYDRPTVKVIVQQVAANDYRFSSLVLAIVNSLPFQMQGDPPAKEIAPAPKTIANASPAPSPVVPVTSNARR
jgi:mono/diheme cytochrome c family protein